MYLAVAASIDPDAGDRPVDRWRLQEFAADGQPSGAERAVDAAGLLAAEADRPRWLLDTAARDYPAILAAGVSLGRSHDVALTERILLGRAGRFGEPVSAAAVHARATGRPVPADPDPAVRGGQPSLF